MTASTRRVRASTVVIIALGVALVAAPVAFQMFTRAPEGGDMIEEFRPYMTTETIDRFNGYLDQIDATTTEVDAYLADTPDDSPDASYPALSTLSDEWPAIDEDMGDMLTTMGENIGNFRGVSALPPFLLFPWFFVLPGLITAGLGISLLVAERRGVAADGRRRALVAMGFGLIMAPVIFQMFSRAPGGAEMIDDFRPLMTDERVTTIQGYFLTIGVGEGELRTELLPAAESDGAGASLADSRAFSDDWPSIADQMAPMIGTMADNVDNFAAVDAMPPFWAFPWFFVGPGVAVAALAFVAIRRTPTTDSAPPSASPSQTQPPVLEGTPR